MAYETTDYTKLEALVDPQVLAAMLDPVLEGKFKFLDIMEIDYTLQGVPGSVITVPQYEYIGPAEVVPEAELIPISKLVTDMVTFTIEKLGKGVILTDEDLNAAYGKPREQAIAQIATAIADAINVKVLNHLKAIGNAMTVEVEELNGNALVDALVLFGEDEDFVEGDNAEKFLFVSPLDLAKIRKDAGFLPYTETAMRTYKTGDLGTIWGTHVRVSNLLAENEIYLAKKGFVTLHMKANSMIEVGRIQERASWLITGTQHAGTNVTHVNRAVKIKIATPYDSTEQDNTDIATAKANIEAASYTATQAEASDSAKALTKAQALVEALELKGTTATVVAGTFAEATAGTEDSVDGTDGSFAFTVKINKGLGTEVTTVEQTMSITATPYDSTEQ